MDYRLARRSLLSELRKGRLKRPDVCDAHPELLRAAANCGRPAPEPCPVCEADSMVLVSYVFGPRLPAHGRCLTTFNELTKLSRSPTATTCYVVEVCPECAWNHLTRTFGLGGDNRR